MGLCFVGKREFPKLINEVIFFTKGKVVGMYFIVSLLQYLEEKPGFFVNLDGEIVGEHKGAYILWTLCAKFIFHCMLNSRPSFLYHRSKSQGRRTACTLLCGLQGSAEQHCHRSMSVV